MTANRGGPAMNQVKRAEVLRASPQLFDNPLMDRLSRVPWWTPLVLHTPIIIILALISLSNFSVLHVGLAVVAGYLIWTLIEYLGHRFLFHAPFQEKWVLDCTSSSTACITIIRMIRCAW